MDERFEQRMRTVIEKFEQLTACPPLKRDLLSSTIVGGGVYLFSQEQTHYYVGRGKDIRQRIMQHTRPSVLDAPFAFRRAREILQLPATYMTEGGRKQLLADPNFLPRCKLRSSGLLGSTFDTLSSQTRPIRRFSRFTRLMFFRRHTTTSKRHSPMIETLDNAAEPSRSTTPSL